MNRERLELLLLNILEWLPRLAIIAVMFAVLCALCACATQKEVVEKPVELQTIVHDTIRDTKTVYKTNTVYIHDSSAVNEKGGIDRWHKEYRGSEEKSHDTLYVEKEVYKDRPVTVTKTVTKRVRDVRELCMVGGLGAVVGVLAVVVIRRRL